VANLAFAADGGQGVDLQFVGDSLAVSRMGLGRTRAASDKIESAARDFESILLDQWLEQAQESLANAPGGSEEEEEEDRFQLQGIGIQSLATAITRAGGIGIAEQVRRQLDRLGGEDSVSPATANPPHPSIQNGLDLMRPAAEENGGEITNQFPRK